MKALLFGLIKKAAIKQMTASSIVDEVKRED
jgi:hypothetical protein